MAIELIERPDFSTRENIATAVHESAHAHAIESVGARVTGCQVFRDGSGRTNWQRPRDLALEKRALVTLAGPAAEARFRTRRDKRGESLHETAPFLSERDYEALTEVLAEAEPHDFMRRAELYWRLVRSAEAFTKREWNPIVRLAKRMMANGGVYIAEAAPTNPAPAPKPAPDLRAKRERLLREAMQHIWGDGSIYP